MCGGGPTPKSLLWIVQVLDSKGVVLTRLWCLYEVAETLSEGRKAERLRLVDNNIDQEDLKMIYGAVDVSRGTCFSAEDTAMIHANIANKWGSLAALTMRLKVLLAERGFQRAIEDVVMKNKVIQELSKGDSKQEEASDVVKEAVGAGQTTASMLSPSRVRAIYNALKYAQTNFVPPGQKTSRLNTILESELRVAMTMVGAVYPPHGTTVFKRDLALQLVPYSDTLLGMLDRGDAAVGGTTSRPTATMLLMQRTGREEASQREHQRQALSVRAQMAPSALPGQVDLNPKLDLSPPASIVSVNGKYRLGHLEFADLIADQRVETDFCNAFELIVRAAVIGVDSVSKVTSIVITVKPGSIYIFYTIVFEVLKGAPVKSAETDVLQAVRDALHERLPEDMKDTLHASIDRWTRESRQEAQAAGPPDEPEYPRRWFPHCAVSLAFLVRFWEEKINEPGKTYTVQRPWNEDENANQVHNVTGPELTTGEVVKCIIQEAYKKGSHRRYADLLGPEEVWADDGRPPFHFISHAFGNPFKLMIDALVTRFRAANDEGTRASTFVWIDIFASASSPMFTDIMSSNNSTCKRPLDAAILPHECPRRS